MTQHEFAAWLGERLDRLDDKMDATREQLAALAVQQSHTQKQVESQGAAIKPVIEHVAKLKGVAVFIGLSATVLGILVALLKLQGT